MDLNQRECYKCHYEIKQETISGYENLMGILEEQLFKKEPTRDLALFCQSKMNNGYCILLCEVLRFSTYLKFKISYLRKNIYKTMSLRSVAGLVIQATGRTEFEDGLCPRSPGEVLLD